MCGIFGSSASNTQSKIFLEHASKINLYRGPDSINTKNLAFGKEKVLLGHTRLTITGDLNHGVQPCIDQNCYMLYNGEIFNFDSVHVGGLSDTECLFEKFKYGFNENIINSLNGFFAIALFYPNIEEIYLIRDRFGEKPLYYYIFEKKLFFSSSAWALCCFDGITSCSNIKEARGGGILFDENNPLGNIKQVPPGHYISYKNGEVKTSKWYVKKDWSKGLNLNNFDNVVDLFDELLIDSVKIRTKDQNKVAVALSSGLDSTLIADTAKKFARADVLGFILKTSDIRFSEIEIARINAKHINLKLVEIDEPENYSLEEFKDCLKVLEFPSFNFSFVGYDAFYKAISKNGFRVLLEGHGPDEYLGGYATMHRAYLTNTLIKLKVFQFSKGIQEHKVKFGLSSYSVALSILKSLLVQTFTLKYLNGKLVNKDFFDKLSIPIVLRTFDRISMKNEIETRSPFLDHRLVELGQVLDDEILFYKGRSKSILAEILIRRGFDLKIFGKKIGFTSNYSNVMKKAALESGLVNKSLINDPRLSLHKASFQIAIQFLNDLCKENKFTI